MIMPCSRTSTAGDCTGAGHDDILFMTETKPFCHTVRGCYEHPLTNQYLTLLIIPQISSASQFIAISSTRNRRAVRAFPPTITAFLGTHRLALTTLALQRNQSVASPC